jgi:uncharacterized lipoprotein YajG
MLKQLLVILLFLIIFYGCTTQTQSNIKPYVTQHKNTTITTKKLKINFTDVKDIRPTETVSYIYNKNNKQINKFTTDIDIKTWYKNGFIRELKSAKIYNKNLNSDINLSINIKQIKATYYKYSIKKDNLKVKLSIELILNKGNETSKIYINLEQSLYKLLILDAQGFDQILNDIMINSIEKSVKLILQKLTKTKGKIL